ncbi:MAG TPA: hypothetical protein PKC69_01285 [Chitinophagaceae bacterium]|nr:hypothetical protein [Chitinophagaceae bacterium]
MSYSSLQAKSRFEKLYFSANRLCFLFCLTLFTVLACKKDTQKGPEECASVAITGTRLTQAGGSGAFTYRTSGGGTIFIDPSTIIRFTHDDYARFNIELWGDTIVNGKRRTAANHENLIGKHIKDKLSHIRTFIFPDGAKITMTGDGVYGPLTSISIYDGADSHHINPACNTVTYSSGSSAAAQQRDDSEPDGETATIEFTAEGLIYLNIYTENTPGNKVMQRVLLGEIKRDNPNNVTDYFDDPRLGHT